MTTPPKDLYRHVHRFITRIALAVVFMAAWLPATNSFAHAPLARQMDGVIRKIDSEHRLLTFLPAKKTKPVLLKWNSGTELWQDGKLVSASSLKEGDNVRVSYCSPFFGKKFATKIRW